MALFSRRSRPLESIERFEDLLFGIAGAEDGPDGSLRVAVRFKAEKREGAVFIRCAEVAGLGPVAHLSSPVSSSPTPQLLASVLDKASGLFVGDVVLESGTLCLRATVPIARATYADVAALFLPLATAADEFARQL